MSTCGWAGKQRALLALLLVNANRTLALDRIVDDLWGEDVPRDGAEDGADLRLASAQGAAAGNASHAPAGIRARPRARAARSPPVRNRRRRRRTRRWTRPSPASDRAVPRGAVALAWARARRVRVRALRTAGGGAPRGAARVCTRRTPRRRPRARPPPRRGGRARSGDRPAPAPRAAPVAAHARPLPVGPARRSPRELPVIPADARRGARDRALCFAASARAADARSRILPSSFRHAPETRAAALAPGAATVARRPVGDVSYARSGDIRIAYQVVGDGPVDLLFVHGLVCTFQPGWEYPKLAAFYERLASMGRLILFDKRGTGLSDRVPPEQLPDLETRMDDVRAVLDSAGSERAVLLGVSEGGAMSTLFAATHPQRTLCARSSWAPSHVRCGRPTIPRGPATRISAGAWPCSTKTTGRPRRREPGSRTSPPTILHDPEALQWYTSYVRRGASPGAYKAIRLMNAQIDIRDVLPTISVPTLVLHRAHESLRRRVSIHGRAHSWRPHRRATGRRPPAVGRRL